jgi:hypothetical protein
MALKLGPKPLGSTISTREAVLTREYKIGLRATQPKVERPNQNPIHVTYQSSPRGLSHGPKGPPTEEEEFHDSVY